MKASKLIAAVVSGAAALALVGGIAYAMEPDRDPATLPMPEAAQDTSIVKQVASIIVYEDQEEAAALAPASWLALCLADREARLETASMASSSWMSSNSEAMATASS